MENVDKKGSFFAGWSVGYDRGTKIQIGAGKDVSLSTQCSLVKLSIDFIESVLRHKAVLGQNSKRNLELRN